MSQRIYVASSWRNTFQPATVVTLRTAGLEVYDFRDEGFHWSEIDPSYHDWTAKEYAESIDHPIAIQGFLKDLEAMEWADTFVLVLPCGRSAHLELGWAVGQKKQTAILLSDEEFKPELMYRMVDYLAPTLVDLLGWLGITDGRS